MSSARQAVAKMVKMNSHIINRLLSPSSPAGTLTTAPSFSGGGAGRSEHRRRINARLWFLLSGNAAVLVAINSNAVLAKDASVDNTSDAVQLRRIEDDSVKSNIHTSKWRVFTDKGREFFLQGKVEEAEKLFVAALQEAKEGFGERDPHVASASNNLAELYRVNKLYHKAEPLYLEAISILEESFGSEDIRVGSALHNLGQFYIVQRKLDEARDCYEHALKIKHRILGLNHTDCADTMYHLGTVLHLLGNQKDSVALIHDSIRILENSGQGESTVCLKRMRYLAQIYLKSKRFEEAEKVQRKILHIMELTKGWNALDTAITAEGLALNLQSTGSLKEAEELLERCLDARKTLLPQDHIQIGVNLLHIGRVAMLISEQLKNIDHPKAISELDKAKEVLHESVRIGYYSLDKLRKKKKIGNSGASGEIGNNGQVPLVILLQASDALGLLEITKEQLQGSEYEHAANIEAENALLECILAYKEFVSERSIPESPEMKVEYLKCLKRLMSLNSDGTRERIQQYIGVNSQDLRNEIKSLEVELSHKKHPI
ncbi:uncharacterized protein LOC126804968 isoform X2 [Argentina anserina]|uniref:uncharacterized protein LOC126804968 isoform X2 n=1 Tax=Argentina anserina TaxID=57926 RepID=UPI00217686D6|nr:uncharacterized protein LOC126804968 isoform X2 [Potentilla anserina]